MKNPSPKRRSLYLSNQLENLITRTTTFLSSTCTPMERTFGRAYTATAREEAAADQERLGEERERWGEERSPHF